MSSFRFLVSTAGTQDIRRQFTGVEQAVEDMSPAFEQIAASFYEVAGKRFAAEGAFGGPAWAQLTDNPPGHGYRSWKERRYPGKPILELKGGLKASLTRDGTGNVTDITPLAASFGTSLRVGKWNLGLLHQKGTKKMVARPPLVISAAMKDNWTRIIRMQLGLAIKTNAGRAGRRSGRI